LYKEYFQYVPDFKLFVAVNHKPVIQGTDHGIWRRICVVPFTVTIPPEEQDKNLGEKLKAELPGILRWAVEGALLWQKEGLDTPDAVRQATREYRSEMDVLSDFIDECCDVSDPGATISFQDLYYRYQDWCAADNEEPMSRKEFSRRLDERGFTKGRNHALGRFRSGIQLKA
jgi:putative DNA primase/helicase